MGLPIMADEKALAACLAHLLTNAVEASLKSDTPRVVLKARRIMGSQGNLPLVLGDGSDKDAVLIVIEDTGTGIAPESIDKVFSPFHTTKVRGMVFADDSTNGDKT